MKILLKYNLFLFTLLLLLTNQEITGQEYIFRQFTTKNGLPSSQIFHVFQDSKGYIWFATDNGISKYNGYEFANFDINDGLVETSISEIYEDKAGKIWFIGIEGSLAYSVNNEIISYKYNNILSKILPDNPVYLKSNFYVDDNEDVYISIKSLDLIKIDKVGKITEFKNTAPSRSTLSIYNLGNNAYISAIKSRNIETPEKPFNLLLNKKSGKEVMIELPVKDITYPHHTFEEFINDSSFWFSSGNKVFFIQNNKVIKTYTFENEVVWMSFNKKSELNVCSINEGVKVYNVKNEQIILKHHHLNGYTVTSVLYDKHGSYWFTTLNNGVFQLSSENYQKLGQKTGLLNKGIKCIETIGDTVYFGGDDPGIGITSEMKIDYLSVPGINKVLPKAILFDKSQNQLVIATNKFLYLLKNNQLSTIKNHMASAPEYLGNHFNAVCAISDNTGGYWIGGGIGFFYVKYNQVIFNSLINKNFKVRVNSLFLDKNNTLWLGCKDGLRKYKDGKLSYLGDDFEELKTRILDIKQYNQTLVLATKGKGILFFDGKSIERITKKDGLSSNMITSLAICENMLWAGSLNGLNYIKLPNDENDDFIVEKPFELSGFEVNQIKSGKNKMYLATNEGIVICYPNHNDDQVSNQPLYFTSFVINGKNLEVKEKYHLKNNQNNISISFEALNYKTSTPIEYKYKLEGLDANWTYSQKREVNYFNLKPGKYNFVVKVKNMKGSWNDEKKSISIVIAPSLWQTTPFKIGSILLALVLLILIYSIWQANARKKMHLERSVHNYKLKTLWGQMKPHFIFNTLNSINNYIISNEAVSASKYLTKFSALIRKILDYAQYDTINLEEELNTLELYMKIEALRLKQKFDYTITVDETIDSHNTYLPGLILQPFVENSIWHGIQPLDRKGTIKIKISKKESNLVIEIIDNGIGREQAMLNSKNIGSLNKSYGAKIARERLNLFASKKKKKAIVEYSDLITSVGVIGTKVKIIIPLVSWQGALVR